MIREVNSVEIKTDKYTKTVLTIIAITLLLLLFKPQVQEILTPTSAHALTRVEGIVDDKGSPIFLTDVYIRNNEAGAIPVKQTQKIEVYWKDPMPVIMVEKSK